MPRILLLFEYPSINGGENSQLATLPLVRAAGYGIAALAPGRGPLAASLRANHVDVIPWSVHDDHGRRRSQHELREDIRCQLRRMRPDLVHANSLSMARLLGPVSASAGLPSVGHLRDILKLSRTAIDDLNRNRRLLAVSRATRDWHLHHGLSSERTFVQYNGVDLQRFSPRRPTGFLHEELDLSSSARLIGTIGQLGMRKGIDVWLSAAEEIARRWLDVQFLIVGQRHSAKEESCRFERRVRTQAQRGPLRGRVHFLGQRGDVPRLLNELTLVVHAARQEPLGRVVLEAAASATAVVATDVGGTREILPPAQFAPCLVPSEDRQALVRAVGRLLDDDALRRQLSRASRRRMEESFDAADVAYQLTNHYRAVLAHASSSSG